MGSVKDIAPPWLTFYRADDWGVIWKRPPVAERLEDSETYIHHGAGSRFGLDPLAAMRRLQTWYHDVKNYSTIAYDVMAHRNTEDDTMAILGAREGWLSAATSDRNDIGEAVCLFGYFHPGHSLSEQPTEREIEALAFAVAWSIEMRWSALGTNVLGHRDNPAHPGATGCPGDYLYPHVPHIGERALELLVLANQPTEPPIMDQLISLPKPKRVYDSRKLNSPLTPGETRLIPVGAGIREVFVNATCVAVDGTGGHMAANDVDLNTSILNYDASDALVGNGFQALTPNGQLRITNAHGIAHLIIDVMATR